jgi:short-subunit dehydrogenase
MNKTIVISGASRGIGKAIAQRFAAEGFNLALCARSENDLATLKAELQTATNKVLTHACDVAKKEEVRAFAKKVIKEFGAIDILVNNAGTFIPGQVINEEDGNLETLIETNLYSAYNLSRMLLPAMMEKKSGYIFNMCSVAGIKAYPNGGSYSISKFAMMGLSKALREELKEYNIHVTALIPGATYTDSWKSSGLAETRFMKPEDLAKTVWDIYGLSGSTVVEEILLRPMEGDI